MKPANDLTPEAMRLVSDPDEYFGHSYHAMHHIPRAQLEDLQLRAARERFDTLREQIPVLTGLAREQGVIAIAEIDDLVPLLFQHSVYKSYPSRLIRDGHFDSLTRWLDRLTAHDLSGLDASGCTSIDSWLDLLDADTPLMPLHSSGTAGSMSFFPRGKTEWDRMMRAVRCGLFQFSDPDNSHDHSAEFFQVVWPTFRHGRVAILRAADLFVRYVAGSEDRFHAVLDGRMSADVMYLAGALRAAAARGEQLELPPALLARRAEHEQTQRDLAEALPKFFESACERLRGERIWIFGTSNIMYEMAAAALAAGLEGVFAADSIAMVGGGAKGQILPADWEQSVTRFVGTDRLQHAYGMTELAAINKMCAHGNYHLEPWVAPFVLEPETGALLPREGTQTGRAAFFDLLPESYWGGTITGDEVTVDWSPCPCGQTTTHLQSRIERFSDKSGQEDKITCAASDGAHRAALEFLTGELS